MRQLSILLALLTALVSLPIFAQTTENNSTETPKTSIEFVQNEFNFGTIDEGEIIQNVVTFTNAGDEPLVISNAKGSCGCTVPQWPSEPILPGESADLLIQFDSRNKGGVNGRNVIKRVTIVANTEPTHSYVTIKGTVFRPQKEIARYNPFDLDANSIGLSPNPATDFIEVDLSAHAGKKAKVQLYNMQGEIIIDHALDELPHEPLRLDIVAYPSGIYTLSVSLEGANRLAKQVVIQ